jgi:hypothetical protein
MGKVFKDYFLSALVQAWENDQLDFYGGAQKYEDLQSLRELLERVANKKWVAWCEAPIIRSYDPTYDANDKGNIEASIRPRY